MTTTFAARLDAGMTFTHKGRTATVASVGYGTNWVIVETNVGTVRLNAFAVVEVA